MNLVRTFYILLTESMTGMVSGDKLYVPRHNHHHHHHHHEIYFRFRIQFYWTSSWKAKNLLMCLVGR